MATRFKVNPLRDRILIRKDRREEKSSGGIVLPDTVLTAEKTQTGTVIAVGPGSFSVYGFLTPTTIKVGDRVITPKFVGTDLKSLGENLFLLPETEVLAVIEEEVTEQPKYEGIDSI